MEFIRSFPGYFSSGEDTLNRRGMLLAWIRAKRGWIGWIVAVGVGSLFIAFFPAAIAVSLGAGLILRWIGRHLRLKAAAEGLIGRKLAAFRMASGIPECIFDEAAINRYAKSYLWRMAAALIAGAACLTIQHLHWISWNLLDLAWFPHWLVKTVFFCSPLVPLLCGALCLLVSGPKARWQEKLKAAIRSRAADRVAETMRAGEIDGLEAGTAGLYRQFDLWWAGEYRAAVDRWIASHTAEAIFEPEAAAAFVKSVTEQARIHLNCLAEAAESFRSIECRLYAVEALAGSVGEDRRNLMERAAGAVDELRDLAIARCWDRFAERAAQTASELDETLVEFRLRSRSAVTLPTGTDPYRILGTEASAPTAAIKKLRLRLAQVYHPDIGGETSNDMKMAELNAAYDAVMRERSATAT